MSHNNYRARIAASLDQWGKRQGWKKRPTTDTATDQGGRTQQELPTNDNEKETSP